MIAPSDGLDDLRCACAQAGLEMVKAARTPTANGNVLVMQDLQVEVSCTRRQRRRKSIPDSNKESQSLARSVVAQDCPISSLRDPQGGVCIAGGGWRECQPPIRLRD